MGADQASNPWGARVAVGVIMLILIGGGVYYYVNVMRPQSEIAGLKKTIETAANPMAKAQAIRELANKKDPDTAPIFIKRLDDADAAVRRAAADALGTLGQKTAAEPLMGLLADKDPKVRQAAVTALGLIKAQSAVDSIVKILNDKDAGVQREAVFALVRIGDKSAVETLKKYSKTLKDMDFKRTVDEMAIFLETGQMPR
ncbi:MAG: HEAT repeat domain-containing protein [Planctomycetota bacterium]